MKYTHFVGIDVSKKTLDYSVITDGEEILFGQIKNSINELEKLMEKIFKVVNDNDLNKVLFCMEHTGIYCENIFSLLDMYSINLWVESALRIKKTMGLVRGKNDRIDAKRIAMFSYRYQDLMRLWVPERFLIKRLKHLLSFRRRTLDMLNSLKKSIGEMKGFLTEEECGKFASLHSNALEGLSTDLNLIEHEIDSLIKEDKQLSYLFAIVTSVSSIGKVTAAFMIATTNEFKSITCGKKYACYAGVVPFDHQSGTSVKGAARVSHMANKQIKSLLHMGAISAISRKGEYRDYYDRKLKEGKNKMSILNAIRNKLVLRVFACVRDGKLYEKNYEYKPS